MARNPVSTKSGGNDGFAPSAYLSSLIAAVNDGAKTAQAGMMLVLLVGLYLLATAFSANDEDILLGKAVTISQIGASLPAGFSFAIAPLVFVFLHLYALTRYDMLGANVRFFLGVLDNEVPLAHDREHCRQLLANTEFVESLTAPSGSSLQSWVWPLLAFVTLAGFPVAVLFIVQINALRYQSDEINLIERIWLGIDIAGILIFFARNRLAPRSADGDTLLRFVSRTAAFCWLPPLIIGMNLAWLNVAPPDADTDIIHGWLPVKTLSSVLQQPLDLVLCPKLHWGCRYLRVERRTLVDHVWDEKAMAALHDDDMTKYPGALAGIEGIVLRGRNLRFAVLDESRLYAADMMGADLRHASLIAARLLRANFISTKLQGTRLDYAKLTGAVFVAAWMDGASLINSEMSDASLFAANSRGAYLSRATLTNVDFSYSDLTSAMLDNTDLTGAKMAEARLIGADLDQSNLSMADLTGAILSGASLSGTKLWHAQITSTTAFDFADLRMADITTAPTDADRDRWKAKIELITNEKRREEVMHLLTDNSKPGSTFPKPSDFMARSKQILISKTPSAFQITDQPQFLPEPERPKKAGEADWVMNDDDVAWLGGFADLLTRISSDLDMAQTIADHLQYTMIEHPSNPPSVAASCRLLAASETKTVTLSSDSVKTLLTVKKTNPALCEKLPLVCFGTGPRP